MCLFSWHLFPPFVTFSLFLISPTFPSTISSISPRFFPNIFLSFPQLFSYHLTLHYFHFYPVFFFPDFSLSSLLRQFYGDFPRLCPNSFFPLWSTPIWGSLSLQRAPWNDNWVFPCTCVKPCFSSSGKKRLYKTWGPDWKLSDPGMDYSDIFMGLIIFKGIWLIYSAVEMLEVNPWNWFTNIVELWKRREKG